jgi:hypothetical protein
MDMFVACSQDAVLSADAERDMLLAEDRALTDQIDGKEVEKPHKTPEDRLAEVHTRLNEVWRIDTIYRFAFDHLEI